MLDKKAFSKWLQARPRLNIATTNASPTFSQDLPSVTSEPDISLEIAKQTIVGQAAQLISKPRSLSNRTNCLNSRPRSLSSGSQNLRKRPKLTSSTWTTLTSWTPKNGGLSRN